MPPQRFLGDLAVLQAKRHHGFALRIRNERVQVVDALFTSTTTSLLSVKGKPPPTSNSRARSGSSTTSRMIALSVVSSTISASTWTPRAASEFTSACNRPRRFGVNTEN